MAIRAADEMEGQEEDKKMGPTLFLIIIQRRGRTWTLPIHQQAQVKMKK